MNHRPRRTCGAMGLGLTWAAGWTPVGSVTGFAVGAAPGLPSPAVPATNYAVMFGVLGLVAGVIFAAVLRLAQVALHGVGDDLTREAMASVGVGSATGADASHNVRRVAAGTSCATVGTPVRLGAST